ncbi:hypothetical protein I7I53_12248 [Histoplasma capsulatum var. duboisii H88]|uniref:Uncharacterized protein n=1 Tax=Ajellomyces capsulatus (strain H88) TaxID=544711 RepID=A0A8A1LZF7_AJEC8|nr:hypothetical protein I7I53_12248 [Histoplasma capsulatum var. duboisii H88]
MMIGSFYRTLQRLYIVRHARALKNFRIPASPLSLSFFVIPRLTKPFLPCLRSFGWYNWNGKSVEMRDVKNL